MTAKTATPQTRLGLMVLPFAAVAGFLATGAVIMHDLRSNDAIYYPIEAEISEVEFLSDDGGSTLRRALTEACAMSGCDAHRTEVFVRAGLAEMTEDDLAGALRLQAVTLGDLSNRIELAESAEVRAGLEAEFTAEAEITALYRSELRTRPRVN